MAYTHSVGTACELKFASDALLKGYDVYMPCVGTQEGHDVVILKEGIWTRVQVKKAAVRDNGQCVYLAASLNGNKNKSIPKDLYDALALVCLEMGKVWLLPVGAVVPSLTISKSLSKLSEWDQYLF